MEGAGLSQSRMGLSHILEESPAPISSADRRGTNSKFSCLSRPYRIRLNEILEAIPPKISSADDADTPNTPTHDINDANPPMNFSSDAERSFQSASTDNFGDTNFGKPDFRKYIFECTNFGKPEFWKPEADSSKSYKTYVVDRIDESDEFFKQLSKSFKELSAPRSEFAAKETRSEQHANCHPHQCTAKNLGTYVAISGANYCLIAADKMSTGSRPTCDSKITQLSKTMVMASSAPEVEVRALIDLLEKNLKKNKMEMTNYSVISHLGGILHRSPYFRTHNFNVFVGLDQNGKGSVFAVCGDGYLERVGYISEGSGSTFITPLLYNGLKCEKPWSTTAYFDPAVVDVTTTVSESEAIDLVKSCFATATERATAWKVYMGDVLEIGVLNASGLHMELMHLGKKD